MITEKNEQEARALLEGSFGESLHEINERLEKLVEHIFVDDDGFLMGAVHRHTLRALTLTDMEAYAVDGMISVHLDVQPLELRKIYMTYEDSDMTTGEYLCANLDKHAVTASGEAKRRARRAFKAIDRLCENAFTRNPYGRGWLPKPHAGIRQADEMLETSVDQYCKITYALDQYHREAATKAERKRIEEIVSAFADWWIGHDYSATYYGRMNRWLYGPLPHAVAFFLYVTALAAKYTRRKKYRDAFSHCLQYKKTLVNIKRISGGGAISLVADAMARLCELRPGLRKEWMRVMRTIWKYLPASVDKEGYSLLRVGERVGIERYEFWRAPFCIGMLSAGTAALLGEALQNAAAADWAAGILPRFNCRGHFRQFKTGTRVPRRLQHQDECLLGHRMVAWIQAYWRLRRQQAVKTEA